jgi:fibronectin-binding autotransporter adhesin
MKTKSSFRFMLVAILGTSLACLPDTQAGTLSVTNGSFTNLSGLSATGGGWYGGDPAGWSSDAPASGYTVLTGGTNYANLQTLGPSSPSLNPLRQNVGTVDITSDIILTFTQTTLGPYTSGLGSGIYDLASSPLGSYDSGSITSASTVSYTARGVGPGTSLYIAFWNSLNAAGISGVSIADSATTYAWNGGASGVWTNGGGGWTDKFDNTATTYNNAKPVVAQFTNAAVGTNVTVGGNVVVGNIQVSGANYNFSGGTITMTNTTWSVGAGQTASVGSTLAGTTGLTKADEGTLALSASNSYSGGTTVNAGTLALQNANALGSGNLTVNGGTLDLGVNNLTAANLGGTGGTIALGANTLTASMTSGGQFNGTISGSGGLVKTGANYLTLAGSNSYTGGTTISDGTLFVSGSGTLGDAFGAITISNTTSTATLDLRNAQTRTGTITMIGQGARLASGDVNNPGSLINNGSALEMGGGQITVSVSGTGGLNVTGGGTINSSNSYTGATTISGTTGWYTTDQLFVNNANALGAADGVLTISGGNVNLQSNTITRSGNVTISGGGINNGTLSKSGGNFDLQGGTVNASLAGTSGLIKSTTNGASLNGANSYTGGTTISDGTLFVTGAGTLGAASGNVTVTGTGGSEVKLDLRNQQTLTGRITMTGQNARIIAGDVNNVGSLVNNGSIEFGGGKLAVAVSGNGGINVTGGGTIDSSNSYTGATTISGTTGWYGTDQLFVNNANALGAASGDLTISGGTVNLQSNTVTRSGNVTISGGTLTTGTLNKTGGVFALQGGDGSIAVTLAGTAGLTKSGAGTSTLWVSNSYTGATTISEGTLVTDGGGQLTAGTTLAISNGATWQMTGAFTTTNGATRTIGGLTGGGTVQTTTSEFTHNLAVVKASGTDIFSGVIAGSGALVKQGAGTLALGGANSYSGATEVNAGTLLLGNGSGLGSTAAGTTVASGAQLRLNAIDSGFTVGNEALSISGEGVTTGGSLRNAAGNNTYQGKITLAADATIGTAGSTTLTLDVASGNAIESANRNLTIDGAGTTLVNDAISLGAGGLTKIGTGTATLAAANNYSGATAVNAGLLKVASGGSISSSSTTVNNSGTLDVGGIAGNVQVNSGGFLKGSGSVGAFTLASGGTLTPGNSPGTLTASSAIWEAGSYYNWEIDSNASTAVEGDNWDLFSVTGSGVLDMSALSSGATMNLVLNSLSGFDLTSSTNRTWVIAQAGSLLGTGGAALSAGDNVSDYFNINAAAFNAGTPSLVSEWRVEVGDTGKTLNLMAIPEPSTGSMFGLGLAGLVVTRLLRRKDS